MSVIDNGALLKVNGKFINKNTDLFMDCSDTGYICEKATYFDEYENKNKKVDIDGNFYVYAGDEKFMLCFYKGYFYVISHNNIIHSVAYNPFVSETFYFDGLPSVTVEKLDKGNRYTKRFVPDILLLYQMYSNMSTKQAKQHIRRLCKKYGKIKDKACCNRWKASWDYNNNHYEVIFGYGIDNNEDVWNTMKNTCYGFSETEIKIIDDWFVN